MSIRLDAELQNAVEDFDKAILGQVVDSQLNVLNAVALQENLELTRHELRTVIRNELRRVPYMAKHSFQPLYDSTGPNVGCQQTLREVRCIIDNSNDELLVSQSICKWT